jgi:hypothetical protein
MEICVGVDVSKQHLDWATGGAGTVRRTPNTSACVRRLVTRLRRIDAARIVVE